jgi:hypothetical protein
VEDLAAEVWMDELALGSEKEVRGGGKSGYKENIPACSRRVVRVDKKQKEKIGTMGEYSRVLAL